MENKEIHNLVDFLEKDIYPECVLKSHVPSRAMFNYRRKASTFRVAQESKLFKVCLINSN